MTDTLKRITRILVLGTVGLWIGWDLFAFNVGGLPQGMGKCHPFLLFACIITTWTVRSSLPTFVATKSVLNFTGLPLTSVAVNSPLLELPRMTA